MSKLWWGLMLVGVTGCSTSPVNFEHQSELEVSSRGVGMSPRGDQAVVGMFGTTCQVAISDASVGEDYDFPTDDEQVQDAGMLNDEPAVLVVSDFGAHVTYPERYWDWQTQDFGGAGVVEGRIFDDGVVLLDGADGCSVDFHIDTSSTSVDLPEDLCVGSSSLTVTPSGHAFVAGGGDVVSASEEGASTIAGQADLVVWDESAQVLYVALIGSSELLGVEEDGTQRWSAQLDGAIVSVDAMGPLATAAVMLELDNGTGELVTVDGYTGEITSSLATPGPANEIDASDSGGSIAMVLSRSVHFFRVSGL